MAYLKKVSNAATDPGYGRQSPLFSPELVTYVCVRWWMVQDL
jgi:hypothetical protein